MEKIADYTKKFEDAINQNRDDLALASLETPLLFSRFANYLTVETLKLKKLLRYLDGLERKKFIFYSGYADDEEYIKKNFHIKLAKADIKTYIEGDIDIIKHKGLIADQEAIVELLDGYLSTIRYRHASIKNAIDYIKFSAGEI